MVLGLAVASAVVGGSAGWSLVRSGRSRMARMAAVAVGSSCCSAHACSRCHFVVDYLRNEQNYTN